MDVSVRPFTHLHCHSHYSLLDGASSIERLVEARCRDWLEEDLGHECDWTSVALVPADAWAALDVVAEHDGVEAIPIGLENGWHRGPAELAAYGRVTRSLGDPAAECARRQRLLFASHRDATNPASRASLTAALAGRGVPNEQLSRPAYRERMRGSCFVMSPPGVWKSLRTEMPIPLSSM